MDVASKELFCYHKLSASPLCFPNEISATAESLGQVKTYLGSFINCLRGIQTFLNMCYYYYYWRMDSRRKV